MQKIQWRSGILGAGLGAIVILATGAGRETIPGNVSTGYYGRFQGFSAGNTGYVLDTATGKVFSTLQNGDLFHEQKVTLSVSGIIPPNRQ